MNFSKRFEIDRRNARPRSRVSPILDDDFFKMSGRLRAARFFA